MHKKISLKETLFSHMQLRTPDGFAMAATMMKAANWDFPLLDVLQRLQSRGVDPTLIHRLQYDAEVYIENLQLRLSNGVSVSREDGLVMSLKILGSLEAFPSIYLYTEGKSLCEQALQRLPTTEPYPFFAQLRDAYGTKKLCQVKSVMAANPLGVGLSFS